MKSSDDSGAGTMSIGVLAERFGLATHVLRHWESMGLLHPGRDTGGRRRYGADDLTRVATILMLKEAGLGLDAIRNLSGTVDRDTRHAILRAEAEELRSRIAAARASLELIERGLGCAYKDVTQCPNYQRLITERVGSHVPARGGEPPASRDDRADPARAGRAAHGCDRRRPGVR
ncbi:MerR family transcriptional regulator [Streptomyces sp. RFCAC02]|uniref:MerR family transcriptional regulator n=1 Tax=Streptomyces sp. RFCAC02 TaxID=2499143 RepID=UPI001020C7AF|nr:MerR family transcriptional regulator [Streptomyces sp. RFCAC02]